MHSRGIRILVFLLSCAVVVGVNPALSSATEPHSQADRPVKLAGGNFDTPTSPCYRARQQGPVTNFHSVPPKWSRCPWLTLGRGITGFCTANADNRCPSMTDVKWKRWAHRRAVGVGWLLPPDRPAIKYKAEVVMENSKLLYTRTGRTWGYTRVHVKRTGGATRRTPMDRSRSRLLYVGAGPAQCGIIVRRFGEDFVRWVIEIPDGWKGGFDPRYSVWQGPSLSTGWRRGRLYGFNTDGPRTAVRVLARPGKVRIESRRDQRSSAWMDTVSSARWQDAGCPLD